MRGVGDWPILNSTPVVGTPFLQHICPEHTLAMGSGRGNRILASRVAVGAWYTMWEDRSSHRDWGDNRSSIADFGRSQDAASVCLDVAWLARHMVWRCSHGYILFDQTSHP